MRILLVGADSRYAIERPYFNYLAKIEGVSSIDFFKAQNLFLEYYNRSTINKIWYRAGLSSILPKINQQLRSFIEEQKPDVVWIFKGMEIVPQTLKWIKDKKIKIVNYNPDNPFLFSGRGSGNRNIIDSVGLYDLHFTYDLSVRKRIEESYGIPCATLPFGFDLSEELYTKSKLQSEIAKTCFVGSADKDRTLFVNQLAKEGILIDVYGNDWAKFFTHKNIQKHQPVYNDDFWLTLRKYRVQLNLMRPHNPHSHNMRTFEVPGVGGVQLAPDTEDHKIFFEPEKEIFIYKEVEECRNQIKNLLSLSKDEADKVRLAARSRSLSAGYGYDNRAKQVMEAFKQLF